MSSITKKQSTLVLLVLVFATFMIAGTVLSNPSGYTVFAKKEKQEIDQSNKVKQKSTCATAGAFSPVSDSCNNDSVAANANAGGNARAGDSDGDSDQKIGQ